MNPLFKIKQQQHFIELKVLWNQTGRIKKHLDAAIYHSMVHQVRKLGGGWAVRLLNQICFCGVKYECL